MERWQKIILSALMLPATLLAVGSLIVRILPTYDLPGFCSFLGTIAFPWIAIGGLIVAWLVTKPGSETVQK